MFDVILLFSVIEATRFKREGITPALLSPACSRNRRSRSDVVFLFVVDAEGREDRCEQVARFHFPLFPLVAIGVGLAVNRAALMTAFFFSRCAIFGINSQICTPAMSV